MVGRLREAILDGALKPGERLVETDLAARLGVSRAPVREALWRLESEALVTSSARKGRFVAILSAHDAREVYTLRTALESAAVTQIVGNLRPSLITDLQRIIGQMREAASRGDRARLSRLDVAFHRAIAGAPEHRRLARAWDGIADQIRLLSQQVVDTRYADLDEVADRHQLLLDTLMAGDAERAVNATRDHIDSVATGVIGQLDEIAGRTARQPARN